MSERVAVVDEPKCTGCSKCVEACMQHGAMVARDDSSGRSFGGPVPDSDRAAVEELCAKARFKPNDALCVCTQTKAAEVAAAIIRGVHEPEALTLETGIRAGCGIWCITPVLRLLAAHGATLQRSAADYRICPEQAAGEVAIWSISDEVAAKYPEYYLAEDRRAVTQAVVENPIFPDIVPETSRDEP
jgi:bacterioferritin-associated ferredoxin